MPIHYTTRLLDVCIVTIKLKSNGEELVKEFYPSDHYTVPRYGTYGRNDATAIACKWVEEIGPFLTTGEYEPRVIKTTDIDSIELQTRAFWFRYQRSYICRWQFFEWPISDWELIPGKLTTGGYQKMYDEGKIAQWEHGEID